MSWGYERCDHEYEAVDCLRCGKYAGQVCIHCREWHDGGDYAYALEREGRLCECPGGPLIEAERDDDA